MPRKKSAPEQAKTASPVLHIEISAENLTALEGISTDFRKEATKIMRDYNQRSIHAIGHGDDGGTTLKIQVDMGETRDTLRKKIASDLQIIIARLRGSYDNHGLAGIGRWVTRVEREEILS